MLSRFLTWISSPDEAKDRLIADRRLESPAPEVDLAVAGFSAQTQEALSAQSALDGEMLRRNDGTLVPFEVFAATRGLCYAVSNPGTAPQMCKNAPCPHGVECKFLHLNEESGSTTAASSRPGPGGPMLQLSDGTCVLVADLAPTQGLAFAMMQPGESQLCTICSHRALGAHAGAGVRFDEPRQGSDVQERAC
jgi:hypothetical protein